MTAASSKHLADTNLLVRTLMEKAISDNGWSSAEYAKHVGVSAVKVISLRKGLIMIDALTVGELLLIGDFHKVGFTF